MTKTIFTTFLLLQMTLLFAQQNLPILHSNIENLTIRDGDALRKNNWTLTPSARPDVYVANKTSLTKTVTFYSDIDSLSFTLEPRESFDFVVMWNGKDSCFTRLQSGITFDPTKATELQSDTIPFTLTDKNNIFIDAIINDQDTVKLMFHTAANSIALTKAATAKMQSLTFDETTDAQSWGGGGEMRYTRGNKIQIGRFIQENETFWEDTHSGIGSGGKFGPNFFGEKVLELDFENRQLIVHSKLPSIAAEFQQLPLMFNRGGMFIKANSSVNNSSLAHQFMIHSGYTGTILYDDQFAAQNGLDSLLTTISESELKDSFGNVLKTKKAVLPNFQLGTTQFPNLPVGFFAGSLGRQKISVLGGDMLRRFHVFFDLQSAQIYLKPNRAMELPYTEVG